jgi:AraC family transcriptional regulator
LIDREGYIVMQTELPPQTIVPRSPRHTGLSTAANHHPESSAGADISSVAQSLSDATSLMMRAIEDFSIDRDAAYGCIVQAAKMLREISERNALEAKSPSVGVGHRLEKWRAAEALNYIETHLGSRLTVSTIARHTRLSTSHFSRAFKLTIGMTPQAYVRIRRLQCVKTLMISTRQTLCQIALNCGFSDQAHLCRRFRAEVGIAPGVWRRMHTVARM